MLGQPQLTAVFALPLSRSCSSQALEGSSAGAASCCGSACSSRSRSTSRRELALTATIALVLALAARLPARAARDAPALRAPARPDRARLRRRRRARGARSSTTRSPTCGSPGFTPPEAYTADLLNLFLPTHLEAVGAGWAALGRAALPRQQHRAGRRSSAMPLLAIVVLYARAELAHAAAGGSCSAALPLATYLSLGPKLIVGGHGVDPAAERARAPDDHGRWAHEVPAAASTTSSRSASPSTRRSRRP